MEFVLLANIVPSWSRVFIDLYPNKAAARIRDMLKIMSGTTKKILDERKRGFETSGHNGALDQKFDLVKVLCEYLPHNGLRFLL